jgi:peptide/nickel transport system substrate-binding protein
VRVRAFFEDQGEALDRTYAIPANSHVSPVLSFWHDPAVEHLKTGLADVKKILQDAGYRVVGGKLYYPAGKTEKLTTE